MPREELERIMREEQIAEDFPIGAKISVMRSAFYGTNTTTIITEEDKMNIESIPRSYTYNW